MSKKRILVFCIDGLKKPIIYQRGGCAEILCEKNANYKMIVCQDTEEAERLYKIKLEDYEKSVRRRRVEILKKNLDAGKLEAGKQEKNDEERTIAGNQRIEREKVVNQIFCQHHFLTAPTFKSLAFSIDPKAVYEGFFDGACKNNPGQGSIGAYLRLKKTTIMSISQKIGKVTNNQAQLISLGHLLAHSYCNGVGFIKIFGDSKLAIQFMNGRYNVSEPVLKQLVQGNQILSSKFSKINFAYIPRAENKEADRLANAVFKKSVSKAE